MTLTKLASMIAKREGKKHQASIGDIREILGILADEIQERISGIDLLSILLEAKLKRAQRGQTSKRAKTKRGKR